MNFFHPAGRLALSLSACFAFAYPSVFAQRPTQQNLPTTAAADPDHVRAFAVVPIRPSNAGIWHVQINPNGDEYEAIGLPLAYTILSAYFPSSLKSRERLPGAPGWIWNDKFDFVAKVAPEDIEEWHKSLRSGLGEPNPMLEAMLQAALADRCKLKVLRVPTTVPGFALVVANRDPNPKRFSVAKRDEIIPDNAQKIPENGRMVPILSPDDPTVHFYATSTASLAAQMSWWGAPVEDRTGLTGEYNFALTRLSTTGDPSVDWDVAALGLKLKPIRISADNIVIDHIERPSPN